MSIQETARAFCEACDDGKGWSACREWCHDDATFSCQSAALAEITTLEAYTDWAAGLLGPMPDARYEILALTTDEENETASAFSVFKGTHTGEGGPIPPTGKATATEYVYLLRFEGGRIRHMSKVWNDGFAFTELGWA